MDYLYPNTVEANNIVEAPALLPQSLTLTIQNTLALTAAIYSAVLTAQVKSALRVLMDEDIAEIFNTSERAVPVIYYHKKGTVTNTSGIDTKELYQADTAEATVPVNIEQDNLRIPAKPLDHPPESGDWLIYNGIAYDVIIAAFENPGMYLLTLHRKKECIQ